MPDTREVLYDSTSPQFRVGGRENAQLGRDVMSLCAEEDITGMKRLHFALGAIGPTRGSDNEELLYLDGKVLDFGTELELAVGPHSAAQTVFKGKVSCMELALSHGRDPQMRVFAEDKLMDLRMTRRFKTFENVSDADLVQEIASKHGLRARADVDGPTYKTVQQWNESDLSFLRDRAHRLAAEIWLDGQDLHMASRDKRTADAKRITLIQGGELMAVEVRADLSEQRTSEHVSGYDETGKDAIDEEAAASVVNGEASGGRSGPSVLSAAFGDRVSYRVRDVPFADGEARAQARAAMLRRGRRFITVRGVTLGTPALATGCVVKLERVGALFEGDGYCVTRVAHTYDTQRGYRTRFEAERPWIGRAS
jgi:phage protein D